MFGRQTSVKLMNVFGIRVGVDASWFFVLFLLIFVLSGSFRDTLHGSQETGFLTAVGCALLLYASLVVHELGHALTARAHGIDVKRIDLFLFGGLTHMSRDTNSPGEEFRVAAAGPLATLGVVLVILAVDLAVVGPHRLWHAVRLDSNIHITPVLLVMTWLLSMNVVILIFNLVPAFPLDGGRIARAIVWRVTGNRTRGTRTAAKLGQGFAALLAGLGVFSLVNGDAIGLWWIALAFLIGQAARGALLQSAVTERIEGVRVADIMDRQPVAIPSETSIDRALDEFFLRYGWSFFPVIDAGGRFMGIAQEERVRSAHDGGEGSLTVGGVVGGAAEAEEARRWQVDEDRPLTDLLSSEPLRHFGALMAVDHDGVLRGVVTVDQVRRALHSAFG
jgi:Zn-dependent protease